MVMNEQLICPNTADQCAYSGYCIEQKCIADDGGPTPGSSLGRIHEQMAEEAIKVMTSFCADERIYALKALSRVSLNERIKSSATMRAGQIELSKSFFQQGQPI